MKSSASQPGLTRPPKAVPRLNLFLLFKSVEGENHEKAVDLLKAAEGMLIVFIFVNLI